MRFFTASVAAVLCGSLLLGCQSISTTNYEEKENRRDFTIDAAGGSYAVSLFPKTYSALAGPSFSLVVLSPVLVSDAVLTNSGKSSLIPWFNARGVPVWLVRIPPGMPLEKFGRQVLPTITSAIRKNSNDAQWVMAGVSLGGQAVAHYLDDAQKNATVSGMLVKAAFFLGTGFDYAYPASFSRRLSTTSGQNICSDEFCTRYLSGIKQELVSPRSALFDAAGSPCFCRFWHFTGTNNEWLDRCANASSSSATRASRISVVRSATITGPTLLPAWTGLWHIIHNSANPDIVTLPPRALVPLDAQLTFTKRGIGTPVLTPSGNETLSGGLAAFGVTRTVILHNNGDEWAFVGA